MDMNTIALIKGLAGNGGGGGSSGGGVLVVHEDDNEALDKTWQEIYDADFVVFVYDVMTSQGRRKEISFITKVNGTTNGFFVELSKIANGQINTDTYKADSADGYPVYTE